MNPELQRNLWLECAPSRLAFMGGVFAIIVAAILILPGEGVVALPALGEFAFIIAVIIWGTRNAARAVIGELRERTWDFQRLSSIRPAAMTIGKLYGATSFTWAAGAVALGLILVGAAADGALGEGLRKAASLVAIGLLAHAVALGSALLSARRGHADAKVAILPHQLAGLAAALAASWSYAAGNVALFAQVLQSAAGDAPVAQTQIVWWGLSVPVTAFLLLSTLAFAVFAVLGCWRLMRLELMMTNAPIVWPAFLVFLPVWVIGLGVAENFTVGLIGAYVIVHLATAVALLVEPKSLVDLRAWMGAAARGDVGRVLGLLPAFGWGFLAAAALALALQVHSPMIPLERLRTEFDVDLWRPWIALGALGFLARDIGIFLFFHAGPRQRRADTAAVVVIALLYLVAAPTAAALFGDAARGVFAPSFTAPAYTVLFAWAQAAAIWMAAGGRVAQVSRNVTHAATRPA